MHFAAIMHFPEVHDRREVHDQRVGVAEGMASEPVGSAVGPGGGCETKVSREADLRHLAVTRHGCP
jgi:hypothetical protein